MLGEAPKVMVGFSGRAVDGEEESWTVPVLSTVQESQKRWFLSTGKSKVAALVGPVSSVLIMLLYELEYASAST